MNDISESDAEVMIRTIEKFYQIMCEGGENEMTNENADFYTGSILKKLVAFMIPILQALILRLLMVRLI